MSKNLNISCSFVQIQIQSSVASHKILHIAWPSRAYQKHACLVQVALVKDTMLFKVLRTENPHSALCLSAGMAFNFNIRVK